MKRSPLPAKSCETNWKELYIAALFESDKSKLAAKITQAEVAIVARRRKSMMPGGDMQERNVLDAALLSLQALANCLLLKSRVAA
jgi:hypothetical protein